MPVLLLAVTGLGFKTFLPAARASGMTTMTESSPTVKQELIAVVDAQLVAFRANDFSRAYSFAAQGIRSLFPAADFEKMVRAGYPVIVYSASAEYGLALDTGEDAALAVRITGADGKTVTDFLYTLSREDGVWKITGVSEVKAGGLQA